MNKDQERFYRALQVMEDEESDTPIAPDLAEKLVRTVLAQQRADAQRRRRWVYAAGALALAACLAIFALRPPTTPAPSYALNIHGDTARMGSADPSAGPIRLTVDSVLSITLTAPRPAADGMHIHSFLRQGTSLRAWLVEPAATQPGVFKLRAPVRELRDLQAGANEVVFAIGSGSTPPSAQELSAAIAKPSPVTVGSWHILHQTLEIVAQ